jgi:hypothetical protein
MTNAGTFVIISVVGLISLISWICLSDIWKNRSAFIGVSNKVGDLAFGSGRANKVGEFRYGTGREAASKCEPDKYRGVSESFWERNSKREALMRCGEQDFLNLIRVQGGAEPKLLSARTEPVKEGLYGDRREYVVPNIVHFIWFHHPLEFKFRTYLTYLSVYKFIKPHYILLHGDVTPTGYWWNRTVADVPNIYHVHVDDKKSMFGQNFAYPTQHSDVLRLYIILGK